MTIASTAASSADASRRSCCWAASSSVMLRAMPCITCSPAGSSWTRTVRSTQICSPVDPAQSARSDSRTSPSRRSVRMSRRGRPDPRRGPATDCAHGRRRARPADQRGERLVGVDDRRRRTSNGRPRSGRCSKSDRYRCSARRVARRSTRLCERRPDRRGQAQQVQRRLQDVVRRRRVSSPRPPPPRRRYRSPSGPRQSGQRSRTCRITVRPSSQGSP